MSCGMWRRLVWYADIMYPDGDTSHHVILELNNFDAGAN